MADVSISDARIVALENLKGRNAILKCRQDVECSGASLPELVGDCLSVFWWGNQYPLYEFPHYDRTGTRAMGYTVVSGTTDLPPIIEVAYEGSPLSQSLNQRVIQAEFEAGERCAVLTTYHFLSPIEIVASVQRGRSRVFFEVPTMMALAETEESLFARNRDLDNGLIAECRRDRGLLGNAQISQILYPFKPVTYNQFYRDGCICGCSAVAWGMMASSWKRMNKQEMFPGSACWHIDWPSTSNPVMCQDVADAIWRARNAMETSCQGITSVNKVNDGEQMMDPWHVGWDWDTIADPTGIRLVSFINQNRPVMFHGQGPWSRGSGHSTLCYGYTTAQGTRAVVCKGWGTAFPDSEVALSAFSGISITVATF